jgi:hypothetical protein
MTLAASQARTAPPPFSPLTQQFDETLGSGNAFAKVGTACRFPKPAVDLL